MGQTNLPNTMDDEMWDVELENFFDGAAEKLPISQGFLALTGLSPEEIREDSHCGEESPNRGSSNVVNCVRVPLLAIAALLWLLPTSALAMDGGIGLSVGPIISELGQPEDEPGDSTFMSGTSFTGVGVSVGLQVELQIWEVIWVDMGIFWSYRRAEGWQKSGEQSRTVVISTNELRLPLLVKAVVELPLDLRISAGLGPEFAMGIGSTLEITEENIQAEDALMLVPAMQNGVYLSCFFSIDYTIGDFRIPLGLRFAYNPAAGNTTPERFEGWESAEEHGALKTEFDWDLQVLLGVLWSW